MCKRSSRGSASKGAGAGEEDENDFDMLIWFC